MMMFDNERYDHTYCRALKDGEEVNNRKHTISAASGEPVMLPADCELSDHHVEISTEKENGSSDKADREPMIIVRTKRPRKPTPITVKAFNVKLKTSDGVEISTVVQANHANKLMPSKKIVYSGAAKPSTSFGSAEKETKKLEVKGIVNQKRDDVADMSAEEEESAHESVPHADTEENAESDDTETTASAVVSETDAVIPETVTSELAEPEPEVEQEEPPQLTKSGRMRKLTAKAKQITEESRKRGKQQEKVGVNGEPTPKKKRGRPAGKKNSPKPEGAGKDKTKAAKPKKSSAKAAKKSESSQADYLVEYLVSSGTATTEELPQDDVESEKKTDHPTVISEEVKSAEEKSVKPEPAKVTKKAGKKSTTQSKKSTKPAAKETTNTPITSSTTARVPRGASKKSPQSAKSSSKTSKKSNTRTASKPTPTRAKLVVVTKLPPKRRAQEKATNNKKVSVDKTASKSTIAESIPAAKIDLNNIVRGSRRRK